MNVKELRALIRLVQNVASKRILIGLDSSVVAGAAGKGRKQFQHLIERPSSSLSRNLHHS